MLSQQELIQRFIDKLGLLRDFNQRRFINTFLFPNSLLPRMLARRLYRTAQKVYKDSDPDANQRNSQVHIRTKKLNKCRLNLQIFEKIPKDVNSLLLLSCGPQIPGGDLSGWKDVFLNIRTHLHLSKLSMQWCQIDDNITQMLSRNLPYLSELHLPSNRITDQGVLSICKHMKYLKLLTLYENNIGDVGAVEIAHAMPNLLELSMNSNHVTDVGALEIARNLIHLRELWLINNQVGDQGAVALVASLSKMTWFSIEINQLSEIGKQCCKSMMGATMWVTI